MRQLTINIPDYFYQTFMEYFTHIPEAALVNESSFVISKENIMILDKSSSTPLEECLSIEVSNKQIKK